MPDKRRREGAAFLPAPDSPISRRRRRSDETGPCGHRKAETMGDNSAFLRVSELKYNVLAV
jgi:hypothetical protein